MAYDVFLSHGSPDKPWVRQLHTRLEAAGMKVYLDEVAIEAGDNWVRHLSDGIGQTSTFVIVVSQGTAERPWVTHEWTSFMATHGPKTTMIPVKLDHVDLPPFLKPFQVIDAIDRNVDAVAARLARAVGKGNGRGLGPDDASSYSGEHLIFTVASVDNSDQLTVTSTDGTQRTVTAPWESNAFGIALMDFEQLTRASALDDVTRARLVHAAQTIGTALFDVLFSDDTLRTTFARATAPGPRAVLTVQSDDDMLLSLPWELLYHESRFLVRDGLLDVVRSTTGQVQFATQLTPPSEPFTVVTHIAAPEGSALSYEEESYRITHALTDHCPQTATELGTLDDLVDTVTRTKPRGIHFSGHGNPGGLVFEDDEGFEDWVTIERVVTALRQRSNGGLPPFFFLASCHGNTPARPAEGKSGSASSAARLHREGVTEVVGYYGPIVDELSTRAEEAFYAAIAAGESTRLAVTRARAALQRAFDGDPAHRPASPEDLAPVRSGHAIVADTAHVAPFAWAQLVFYHRGPEHPLGTPASPQKLRQREASLQRTYRNVAGRAFLASGFIGRRRELHQLRRRRKRGDRIFILQGLGGLGKTTLAGHLLPTLADAQHTVCIWCRRSEGESDQAESLVGQLLSYARARFGSGFEEIVTYVDRASGDDAAQRFAVFLQAILDQENIPLVIYFDNMESLLRGPDIVPLDTAPAPEAFGAWRSDTLQRLWREVVELTSAVEHLYVVGSCRYQNDDLMAGLLAVSPLAEVDLFRLMAWFPALRRLSTRTRGELATRLSGHPRAVEFLDALIGTSIRAWEDSNGEWTPPASRDEEIGRREWDQLVEPVLPTVGERIWSDLLLAVLWHRFLNERARRMLFRMTLLRRPWDDELLPYLADPEDDADAALRVAHMLQATSLLEHSDLTVTSRDGRSSRRPYHSLHAATSAFVKKYFNDSDSVTVPTHHRIGTHLEERARQSGDLPLFLEAGYHLFQAGEYDRAFELLNPALLYMQRRGRVRESQQILMPFLNEPVQRQLAPRVVGQLLSTVGRAFGALGESRRAIEYHQQALEISRQIGDRRAEEQHLGNLGSAHGELGEAVRAIEYLEQVLTIAREFGDRLSEGKVLANLGTAYIAIGETRRGLDQQEQALVIFQEAGDRHIEGQILCNVGNAYSELGEPRRAVECHEQALALARQLGDRHMEGKILGNLGKTYGDLGEPKRAIDLFQRRLVIARELGDRRGESIVLGNLGSVYADMGEGRRAIELYEQGFAIAREIGDRRAEGGALGNLGAAYARLGEFDRALDYYDEALVIARAISDSRLISFCENGLKLCAGAASQSRQPQEPEQTD
jgi:tetratricopeptide (TPR) repeat protein